MPEPKPIITLPASAAKRYTVQQQIFMKSPAALSAKAELTSMMTSANYNTRATFSSKQTDDMPFDEKHMQYLCEHPKLNPRHYIANLRLMTKVRQ